jgi:hypothetical protein
MIIHPSITPERVVEAVQRAHLSLDDPGFCAACGADLDGCEPDMRNGPCEVCGCSAVYGAEELLFHLVL